MIDVKYGLHAVMSYSFPSARLYICTFASSKGISVEKRNKVRTHSLSIQSIGFIVPPLVPQDKPQPEASFLAIWPQLSSLAQLPTFQRLIISCNDRSALDKFVDTMACLLAMLPEGKVSKAYPVDAEHNIGEGDSKWWIEVDAQTSQETGMYGGTPDDVRR